MPTPPFSVPISVIVPVYNAPLSLKNLVTSLSTAVPHPIPGLTFRFLDDGSPDPGVRQLFTESFFSRSDVKVETRTENLGFIFTVNEGISKSPKDSDIVILNSDTEIWREVFSTLQDEAYADPNTASITPLTNNGTIASLFSFPSGEELPSGLSAQQVSETVAELQIPSPRVPIPTGVGFCMYMKRAAIQSVGLLDSIYGKGYGEECDWSRKAVSQGWHHLISTRAFVYHSGTQSFKSETKKRAIQQNSLILNRRFPEYDFEVASYVRKDPLWLARIEICLTLLIKNKKTDSLITLEIVQNEPPLLTLKGACAGAFTFQERFHPHCLPLLLTFLKTYGAQVQILQEKLAPLSDQETTQANLAQKMRTEILLIDQISKERDQLLEQLTQLGGANSLLFKFMAKLKRILDRYPLFKSMLRNTITLSWRLAQKARL